MIISKDGRKLKEGMEVLITAYGHVFNAQIIHIDSSNIFYEPLKKESTKYYGKYMNRLECSRYVTYIHG